MEEKIERKERYLYNIEGEAYFDLENDKFILPMYDYAKNEVMRFLNNGHNPAYLATDDNDSPISKFEKNLESDYKIIYGGFNPINMDDICNENNDTSEKKKRTKTEERRNPDVKAYWEANAYEKWVVKHSDKYSQNIVCLLFAFRHYVGEELDIAEVYNYIGFEGYAANDMAEDITTVYSYCAEHLLTIAEQKEFTLQVINILKESKFNPEKKVDILQNIRAAHIDIQLKVPKWKWLIYSLANFKFNPEHSWVCYLGLVPNK